MSIQTSSEITGGFMSPEIPATELFKQLSSSEAAKFLGQSEETLARRRRDGTGPRYLRINSSVVKYRLYDLLEHQERHLEQGGSNG